MKCQALYNKLISKIIIDQATGCWLWTGPFHKDRPWPQNRYGYISIKKPDGRWTCTGTHRAMLIAINGWLTREQCACHKCDVPLCINPDHLFIGTMKENIWDSRNKGRHHESKKDHCDRGHPLFGENVRIGVGRNGNPKRVCLTCETARYRLELGWPPHLAFDRTFKVPAGYMLDRKTWQVVPGKGKTSPHPTPAEPR